MAYHYPESSKVVVFKFQTWDITLRELIFSALIVGVMVFIGFLISSNIVDGINSSNLKFRQAVEINTDSEFSHAINTNVGDAFVNGNLEAGDSVSYGKIDGKYLSIGITYQEYRMHTSLYTTTDSKGNVHLHVRNYWTWDDMDSKFLHSDKVKYCGIEFPYGQFNYSRIEKNETIESTGYRRREIIVTMTTNFNATIFGHLANKRIDGSPILSGLKIPQYRNECITSTTAALWLFWVIWGIVIGLVLFVFFVIDNKWLEDSDV